jgi:hypothetical protein
MTKLPLALRGARNPGRLASLVLAGALGLWGAIVAPAHAEPKVVTYQIGLRGTITTSPAVFSHEVKQILAAPNGWASAGVEFQQVDQGGQFTLWLAEDAALPGFSGTCSTGLSCRSGNDVIINQERWVNSAPPGVMDHVALADYRTMVVNHEVGHWLGHGHADCSGTGQLAPLMMQQSKGLNGCDFNPVPLESERTTPNL